MMRVSNKMIADQTINSMNRSLERLNELSIQAASMKKYQNVSDNPVEVTSALTIKSSIRTAESYKSTAQGVDSWMTETDQTLRKISALLITASNKVEASLNDTVSADERLNSYAPELDTMLNEVLDLSNTTYMNRYIFAGFKVDTKPFSLSTTDPNVVNYNGDAGVMQQDIGAGQAVTMNINNSGALGAVFDAIIRARNALRTNDTTTLSATLTDLSSALSGINDIASSNGARMRQVESVIEHLDTSQLTLKSLLSQKEDANMAEAAVLLKNQETTYQAVLEVGNRAISALSLFDILK
jgi:flagellar hook-associated protein 3 FlgL